MALFEVDWESTEGITDRIMELHADDIKALLRQGIMLQTLADHLALSENALRGHLKKRQWDHLHPQCYRVISEDEHRHIVSSYLAGMPVHRIAFQTDRSENTITKRLKREGVFIPYRDRRCSQKLTPKTAEAMARDYVAGHSLGVLSDEYELTERTVRKYLKAAGVFRRYKNRRDPQWLVHRRRELVRDYLAGMSMPDMCEAYDAPDSTIIVNLQSAGVWQQRGAVMPEYVWGRCTICMDPKPPRSGKYCKACAVKVKNKTILAWRAKNRAKINAQARAARRRKPLGGRVDPESKPFCVRCREVRIPVGSQKYCRPCRKVEHRLAIARWHREHRPRMNELKRLAHARKKEAKAA